MALSTNSVPYDRNGQTQGEIAVGDNAGGNVGDNSNEATQDHLLHLNEVAGILRVAPEAVLELSRANGTLLSNGQQGNTNSGAMLFTHSDLAILINAQQVSSQQPSSQQVPLQQANTQTSGSAQSKATSAESSHSQPDVEEKKPIPLREHMARGRASYQERAEDKERAEDEESSEDLSIDYQGYVPSQYDEYRPPQEEITPESINTEGVGAGKLDSSPPPSVPSSSIPPIPPIEQSNGPINAAVAHEQPAGERALPLSPDQMLGEMLSTVANSQQSVLNVQDSIREMLNVIAQDNFNLKHENRKLRERMLELERILSEHQRREETRKEMLESRMRAVEGTLSALQQQLAQLVQLQRQRIRQKWFK